MTSDHKPEKISDLKNFVRKPTKDGYTETELPTGWDVERIPKRPATQEEMQRVVEQVIREEGNEPRSEN